jgi:hypothetical protein
MKKRSFSLLVAVFAVCMATLNGCKEVGPVLPWGNTSVLSDTTYTESPQSPETKNVLIEMFTGVSCINCPQGHAVLDGIMSADTPRVIGVALHSTLEPTAQDDSLTDSRQGLGCADAQTIINKFGDLGARPIGAVDRILHSNNTVTGTASIYDDRSTWNASAANELAVQTPVNMVLTGTYAASTRTMTVSIEMHYNTASTPDSNKVSIFLTEDSIVTAQLNGAVNDSFYVHNGVLRKALSTPTGDLLNVSTAPGVVVRRIYSYSIPAGLVWNPAHLHIVAFVHKYLNGRADILQVKEIAVVH